MNRRGDQPTRPRIPALAAAFLAAVTLIAIATLAMPVHAWRTGETPAPPLPVVDGGPATTPFRRVWVDTDAACGAGPEVDSDDCLALLYLAHSPRLQIAGISTVAGNATLAVTDRTTRRLVRLLAARASGTIPVYRGASVHDPGGAVAALRRALQEGPMTIVALGPLTNIVEALRDRPQLKGNVIRLVAVMGRRPGHVFHPAEGRGDGILFGHGPVFSDFNVAKDPAAARRIIAMHLPLTLVPYDAARETMIDARDLDRLAHSGAAGAWVASRSRDWLNFWNHVVGLRGYYPFDLMAAAYADRPARFNCAHASVWAARPSGLLSVFYHPLGVFAGLPSERPANVPAAAVIYCTGIRSGVKKTLMDQLAGTSPNS